MHLLLCDYASFSCALGLNSVNGFNSLIFNPSMFHVHIHHTVPVTIFAVRTQYSFNYICESIEVFNLSWVNH